MATSVVQSGDYLLELDTGFQVDAFRLDTTPNGVLNNTDFVLDGTSQFADITPFATDITYKRGRQKTDDQFGAGTMTFTMLDNSGILGPYDINSPYYDPLNNEPGLAPLRKVRLSRDGIDLFTGTVTGYDYNFDLGALDSVTVQCADDFYRLAQTQMIEHNPSQQLSGARVTAVLGRSEVDYTGPTDIATGVASLGGGGNYKVPAGQNVLAYLQQINQAEQGRLFMAADGELVFEKRIGTTLSAPIIAFGDLSTAAKYTNVTIEFDADNVVNRAFVQALDNKTATATIPASITKYFTQSQSITNSLLHQQTAVDDLAAYLLNGEPQPRYTSVTTTFSRLTNTQKTAAATVDIGDTISVSKQIPGLNSQIGEELAVEGIEGSITVAGGHQVTYYTSPVTIVFLLVLDDPVLGELDADNVLG